MAMTNGEFLTFAEKGGILMKNKILWSVIIIIALAINSACAFAYTSYEELVAEHDKYLFNAQDWNEKADKCQAYLDAVNSGDKNEWEKARKNLDIMTKNGLNSHANDEIEYIESTMKTYRFMAQDNEINAMLNEEKQEIYYSVFIKQDKKTIDIAKENGYPVYPEAPDNYWFLRASQLKSEDCTDVKENMADKAGTVYLLTGKVASIDDGINIDCDGYTAKVIIGKNEEGVSYGNISSGDEINIFAMLVGAPEDFLLFWSYGLEDSIDRMKMTFIRKTMENK